MQREITEYNGYRFIRYPKSTRESDRKYFKGWVVINGKREKKSLHRYMWLIEKGDIPKGYVVHHIDGNYSNNTIDNLTLMLAGEHEKLHTEKYGEDIWTKVKKGLLDNAHKAAEWHRSKNGVEWHIQNAKKLLKFGKVQTSKAANEKRNPRIPKNSG